MSGADLTEMSSEMLVDEFVRIGLAQDVAIEKLDNPAYSRLFARKTKLLSELKSRDGDGRRCLIALLQHPNRQVRLNAARATLTIDRAAAEATLETIAASGYLPHSADAGMCLMRLREGSYIPT